MKKLLTIVLAVVLAAGFTSTTNAQISVGAKIGIAIPTVSPFSKSYGLGFGGSAIGEYALNENMSVGLNIGYYTFGGKDVAAGYKRSIGYIPIIADFKYFFMTKGFMPYVGLGLGMFMNTSKTTSPSVTYGTVTIPGTDASTSESDFGFVPKLGFWMGDSFKYGASIEYNIVSAKFGAAESTSLAHLGINIGIIYPIGK